jgi:hypothetical protein
MLFVMISFGGHQLEVLELFEVRRLEIFVCYCDIAYARAEQRIL